MCWCRGNVGDHIALLNVYNGWADEDVNYSTQWCFQNFVQVSLFHARSTDLQQVWVQCRLLSSPTSAESTSKIGLLISSGLHSVAHADQLQPIMSWTEWTQTSVELLLLRGEHRLRAG